MNDLPVEAPSWLLASRLWVVAALVLILHYLVIDGSAFFALGPNVLLVRRACGRIKPPRSHDSE